MDSSGRDPLAVGLAAGDQRAFAALYDRFGPRLYRAAFGMLGRREDAEDMVQEVFAAVLQTRKNLGAVQNLTAYLFTALRRAAARCAARRRHDPMLSETILDEAAATTASPDFGKDRDSPYSERLDQALAALPEEQREILALKIDGELTFAEIAAVLEISINTAASRYRYALEKLRASLKGT